jgi:hypothetical protein
MHQISLGELQVLEAFDNDVAGVHGTCIQQIMVPEFDHKKPPAPVENLQ